MYTTVAESLFELSLFLADERVDVTSLITAEILSASVVHQNPNIEERRLIEFRIFKEWVKVKDSRTIHR